MSEYSKITPIFAPTFKRPKAKLLTVLEWFTTIVIVAVALLYLLELMSSAESTWFLTILATLFGTAIFLLIAYLAQLTYRDTGSRAILMMGCGALIFGSFNLLNGFFMTRLEVADRVYNIGALLAGLCFLYSSILAVIPKSNKAVAAATLRYLGLTYFGVLWLSVSLAGEFLLKVFTISMLAGMVLTNCDMCC